MLQTELFRVVCEKSCFIFAYKSYINTKRTNLEALNFLCTKQCFLSVWANNFVGDSLCPQKTKLEEKKTRLAILSPYRKSVGKKVLFCVHCQESNTKTSLRHCLFPNFFNTNKHKKKYLVKHSPSFLSVMLQKKRDTVITVTLNEVVTRYFDT